MIKNTSKGAPAGGNNMRGTSKEEAQGTEEDEGTVRNKAQGTEEDKVSISQAKGRGGEQRPDGHLLFCPAGPELYSYENNMKCRLGDKRLENARMTMKRQPDDTDFWYSRKIWERCVSGGTKVRALGAAHFFSPSSVEQRGAGPDLTGVALLENASKAREPLSRVSPGLREESWGLSHIGWCTVFRTYEGGSNRCDKKPGSLVLGRTL